jgi:UDP-N-acetyl-D-glucosamine dehydrogenase
MNINNVLEGLQSKVDQFGLSLAKPGIGPGGHCIPEDIQYVIKKAKQSNIDTRLLDSSYQINDSMPNYAVNRLVGRMKSDGLKPIDLKVIILGLAYKPNIADYRRSPSLQVAKLLIHEFKDVSVHDPYIGDMKNIQEIKHCKIEDSLDNIGDYDAVFIATSHNQYSKLDYRNNLNAYIYDGRNCLKDNPKKSLNYMGIGTGSN